MAKPRSCARSTPAAARQPATRRATASTPLPSSTTPDSAASGSSPGGTSPTTIADSTASTATVASCAHSTGRQRREGGPPVGKTSISTGTSGSVPAHDDREQAVDEHSGSPAARRRAAACFPHRLSPRR
ncbi:MAG TPA: hypothetical protein VFQ68_16580 [Streptosporangiaceae bacterium]|nr:hypothetical protein [Streptosporangiaceae bacterium]